MTAVNRQWSNARLLLCVTVCVTLSLFSILTILYCNDSDFGLEHLVNDDRYHKLYRFRHHRPPKGQNFRDLDYRFPDRHRYESTDVWRTPDTVKDTYPLDNRIPLSSNSNNGDQPHWGSYMQQPLAADFADHSQNVFLMVKTGADVLWKRLPVHLFTTLTRVPNFALYSDKPGSVGGYEIIDVLENVTESTLESNDFTKYRKMKELYGRQFYDPSELSIEGGWDLDKYKNIPMLAHAYKLSPNSDWFVFQDADSFMFFDVLTHWLKDLNPNEPLYVGSGAMLGDLLFAHGGSCVLISRKALELTVGQHPEYVEEYEKKAAQTCCGDALVAQMFKEKLDLEMSWGESYPHALHRFQGRQHQLIEIGRNEWCSPIVSFHHLTPHDIETLWEYERLKGSDRNRITYSDIYRDFYQPYLVDKLDHWDNMANDAVFVEKDATTAHESWQNCRNQCETESDCLSWRYIASEKKCHISSKVIFGQPTLDFMGSKTKDTTSGWMIKRIRKVRSASHCDPLHRDNNVEGEPDGSATDFFEGWYRRRYNGEKNNTSA